MKIASNSTQAGSSTSGQLRRVRLLAAGAGELALANVRYWLTVAPLVRGELARWRNRAAVIVDPELRELALAKLDGEAFNAEAGAMLATFAPADRRASVVQAIVALQVLFDLLDGLSERATPDPLLDGEQLFSAFRDALRAPQGDAAAHAARAQGYLQELSAAAQVALARLPGAATISAPANAAAERAASAQIRMHAAPVIGLGELRRWAQENAPEAGLPWRELAAGSASSVLVLHALTAAAADGRTTQREASELANAYLPICVLLTLLDSLTDREQDIRDGVPGYLSLYDDTELLAVALGQSAERARAALGELPHGARHMMILTGVVAYYTSTAGARTEFARPLVARLHRSLSPLITPALLVMRSWRLARAIPRARKGRHRPGARALS